MPNHVMNILKFNKKKYLKIKEELLDKDGNFDFNLIIPRPHRLDLICGGYETEAIQYALSKKIEEEKTKIIEKLKNTECSFYGNYYKKHFRHNINIKTLEEKAQKFNTIEQESFEKIDYEGLNIKTFEDLGNAYINNILEYGYDTWYDWSVDNWGTKWNSYENKNYESSRYIYIEFQTAWSYPDKIIEKLGEQYDFELSYADEDLGNNCGKIKFKNGEKIDIDITNSYRFARRIWGY